MTKLVGSHTRCPRCAEEIRREATICLFCGFELAPPTDGDAQRGHATPDLDFYALYPGPAPEARPVMPEYTEVGRIEDYIVQRMVDADIQASGGKRLRERS